jgi:hypothetical protein
MKIYTSLEWKNNEYHFDVLMDRWYSKPAKPPTLDNLEYVHLV